MTTQEAVSKALSVAVTQRIPVLLWGGPGTGKSSMIKALGESLQVPVFTVIASLREPADFAGLPVVSPDGSIRLAEPAWARDLAIAGRGILFLDEITTAPPAVQAALLRVVLERVVGDLALPDDVAVVAAANPPELAAGGWDLTPPLANRFCHLEWPVDSDRFLEALSAGWSPPETVRTPESGADEAGIQIRATLAGFLRSRPALLYAVPDDISSSGRAWPSPRTWEMAARLWSAAEASNQDDAVALSLLAGCVGPGAAPSSWHGKRTPICLTPKRSSWIRARSACQNGVIANFAVLSAIAAAVVRNPTKERWEAAFLVVEQAVARGSADVAAIAARTLAQNIPEGVTALPPTVASLAPVLGRSGILRRKQTG